MRALSLLVLLATWSVLASADDAAAPRAVTPAISLGISADTSGSSFDDQAGLLIVQVEADGLGASLGITSNDRLLRFNGAEIGSAADLRGALAGLHRGDAVTAVVQRGDKELELNGTVPRFTGAEELAQQTAELEAQVAALEQQPAEGAVVTLHQLLVLLRQVEQDLPKAAEEFKRVYPEGRFRIAIDIEISSDSAESDEGDKAAQADGQAGTEP